MNKHSIIWNYFKGPKDEHIKTKLFWKKLPPHSTCQSFLVHCFFLFYCHNVAEVIFMINVTKWSHLALIHDSWGRLWIAIDDFHDHEIFPLDVIISSHSCFKLKQVLLSSHLLKFHQGNISPSSEFDMAILIICKIK